MRNPKSCSSRECACCAARDAALDHFEATAKIGETHLALGGFIEAVAIIAAGNVGLGKEDGSRDWLMTQLRTRYDAALVRAAEAQVGEVTVQ